MIDALISGKLYGTPQERTASTGNPFIALKLRATAGDGASLFVNVIAFAPDTCAALMALGDGDSVALAGTLTPKAWIDREGEARPSLDMVAHACLSAYHVTRKRKAMKAPNEPHTDAGRPATVEKC
ncbi:single-stranded DNA-binding protein [Acidihalobacter ferrooxydans]|uniref:Single-stranded DNA-binding protein n=1 Tax=Acidihalobacter ferrooxydans TaxID=1765967 RepID=A0A1P8UGI6_9GAMM|nr:single-stranded DNA-binding protein [Acidihalobacter ferrooxydans]APZ42929.1 single-stranded DNA-binding protein [Acidihalobacter ferrooxydans]